MKRKIYFHKDAFKSLYQIPKCISWINQKSHHQRKNDCVELKTRIASQCIPYLRWYDHSQIGTPRAEVYVWADPQFVSHKYNDIQYVLCLRTLQYAFEDNCLSFAIDKIKALLTDEENEEENRLPDFQKRKGGFYEMMERHHRKYDKFDGRTYFEEMEYLKEECMKNPDSSIKIEEGFSVTPICSYAILATGIVNAPFLTIPVVNETIEKFLALEDEFLPVIRDYPVPTRNQYKKIRFDDTQYPFERYVEISKDNLILNKDWFNIFVDKYASPEAKKALEDEQKEFNKE